jgi:clan AA aspartic protease
MIGGHVTAQLEPRIILFVEDDCGQAQSIDAAIDTGYTRYLTLPPAVIATLSLQWLMDRPFELADGTIIRLDVYSGVVIWDGQPRKIEIDAVGRRPLVGMKLLAGHEVHMRVVDGGPVWIDVVP